MSRHGYFETSNAVSDIDAIARHALAQVVTRMPLRETAIPLCVRTVQDQLMDAAVHPDRGAFDKVAAALIAAKVPCQDISNIHIPAVARALGEAWVNGSASFAFVTIGCARLQSYLRNKGLDWCDTAARSKSPELSILLAVPTYEQHTLGATLLAGQLRAQGINVQLVYDAMDLQIAEFIANHEYDAVLLSSSRSETLALLAATVLKLQTIGSNTPVILGGGVLNQISDVLQRTGADFSATCWEDVVGLLRPAAVTMCDTRTSLVE